MQVAHTQSQLCKPGNLNSRKKVRLVMRAGRKPKDSTHEDCVPGEGQGPHRGT